MLIPSPIASAALARPDHPALVAGGAVVTWGQAAERVARLAGGLAASGAGPGSVVPLEATARVETVLALHAIGWVGAAAEVLPLGGAGVVVKEGEPLPERPWPLDEARVIVRTSGSTGEPRPVALTTGQLLLSAFASATRLGLDPADRWLACLPPHHVGGLQILMRSAFYGTTVVLEPRFEAARVAALLDEVTLVSLVPQMLARVLDARAERPFPPRLRAILLGGGPCPEDLLARCRALGAPVALTWGMTEAASQVATTFPGELGDDGAPALPPLPFARVGVEGGRLRVGGPLVGEALLTNDRGRVDGGRVTVLGRADDAIVTGGEKVLAGRVEAALRAHPAVADAAVIGLPSARWGQEVVAAVVLRAPASDAALRAACAPLGAAARPRIVRLDAIPRTALGKVRRAELRRLLQDADAGEGLEQGRGSVDGAEGPRVDHRVHEAGGGAEGAVVPDEGVAERQGAGAALGELEAHGQAVAHADGTLEVGLGVDERGRPLARLEGGLEVAEGGGPHLLERHVAVLEDAPEEHDAGAVHLEEPSRDGHFPHASRLRELSDVAR